MARANWAPAKRYATPRQATRRSASTRLRSSIRPREVAATRKEGASSTDCGIRDAGRSRGPSCSWPASVADSFRRHLGIYFRELANMGVPGETFCIGVGGADQALPQFFICHGNLQLRGEPLVARMFADQVFRPDQQSFPRLGLGLFKSPVERLRKGRFGFSDDGSSGFTHCAFTFFNSALSIHSLFSAQITRS